MGDAKYEYKTSMYKVSHPVEFQQVQIEGEDDDCCQEENIKT